MQKYKFVYETDDEQVEILLPGKTENYEKELESCFIDKYTTIFENEHECVNHLYSKHIIPNNNGSLHIRRPNGKVDALSIIFNDEKLRMVSCKLISQLKNSGISRLPQTSELNSCIGPLIKFFIEDENALKELNKTFCYKKDIKELVDNLNGYLSYQGKNFLEPFEVERRNVFQNNIYSQLRNYDLLRELKTWIIEYKKGNKKVSSSTWKNPYEKFEREKEEREERNNSL